MNPALKLIADIFSVIVYAFVFVVAGIIAVLLHIARKESMRWRS